MILAQQSCLNLSNQESQDALVRFDGDRMFRCAPGDTLLAGALRAGIGMPYECNAGSCGSCKITVVEGSVDDLQPNAAGIKPRERERGKRLACQCKPIGECVISFKEDVAYVPSIRPSKKKATLIQTRDITHDIREFRFKTEEKAEFLPGQYALLSLSELGTVRSYSMSNLGNNEGIWDFQIRRVPNGRATAYLFSEISLGTSISIDGPYGNAYLREDTTREIVCIAGGSGLAPMVSIARGASRSHALKDTRIQLFFGGREPKDMITHTCIPDLFEDEGRFSFIPVMSLGETEEAKAWEGERGFVHDCVGRRLKGNFSQAEFYLAGPPPMVDAVRRMLILDEGVAVERVHYDRFF